jgi:predicted nucleic acid-binding protein
MKAIESLHIKWLPIENGELLEDAALIAEEYDVDLDDAINVLIMQKTESRRYTP